MDRAGIFVRTGEFGFVHLLRPKIGRRDNDLISAM